MITIQKEGTDYIVFNSKNGKCADIISFQDWFMGKSKTRYRVDVSGITKYSLLPLTEAKSKARALVRG